MSMARRHAAGWFSHALQVRSAQSGVAFCPVRARIPPELMR
jgi:hypothetical protein